MSRNYLSVLKKGAANRTFVALAILVALSWVALEVGRRKDEQLDKVIPEMTMFPSTFNSRPTGSRALFELLERVGFDADRWRTSYRDLRSRTGTLIVIAPTYPPQEFEIDQILSWVEKGNRLVFADYFSLRSNHYLLSRLNMSASEILSLDRSVTNEVVDIEAAKDSDGGKLQASEFAHVTNLLLSAETRLDGGRSLASDRYGGLIAEVEHGSGRCLILSTPDWCSNRRIADAGCRGNFQFLANWLALPDGNAGKVYFDEKCHGYTIAPGLFSFVMKSPIGLVVGQLELIFLVALCSLNQRFGIALTDYRPRKIASREFIDGMARTYQKARAGTTAWSIIFHSFRTRLCRALSASPEDSPQELALVWAETTRIAHDECLSFLTRGKTVEDRDSISNEDLLDLVSHMDALQERSAAHLNLSTRRLGG